MKNTCTAIATTHSINLVIEKKEEGYEAFSNILSQIEEKKGMLIWYGDIEDENGKEQSGLKIAPSDRTREIILSIIKDNIDTVEAELNALDREDIKKRLALAIFHLSKAKDEIKKYFNQKP